MRDTGLERYNDVMAQVVAAIAFTAIMLVFVCAIGSAIYDVMTCQSKTFYDLGQHRGLVCSDNLKH